MNDSQPLTDFFGDDASQNTQHFDASQNTQQYVNASQNTQQIEQTQNDASQQSSTQQKNASQQSSTQHTNASQHSSTTSAQHDSLQVAADFFDSVGSQDSCDSDSVPRPVGISSVAAKDALDMLMGDDDDDPQTTPDNENEMISMLMDKTIEMWLSECATPELMTCYLQTPEGGALSDALTKTDDLLQHQLFPSLDLHKRLSLCLNERALKRSCHIIRLLKLRRLSKIVSEPCTSLIWHEAVARNNMLMDDNNNDSVPLDPQELPLEPTEYQTALNVQQQLITSNVHVPLLGRQSDVLHFEVTSEGLTRQKLLEACTTAASTNPTQHSDSTQTTSMISKLVDSAIQRGRLDPENRRPTQSGYGSQNTPWAGVLGSGGGVSSLSSAVSSGEVPVGAVLTMDFSLAQDLVHDAYFVAFT